MKKIGLLGGVSWHSTIEYYKELNEGIATIKGKAHSAKCIIQSIDFQELKDFQDCYGFDKVPPLIVDIINNLQLAGAECALICANTLNSLNNIVEKQINIPIIDMAEAVSEELVTRRMTKAGLLGTAVTMKANYYRDVLLKKNIELIVPNEEDIEILNNLIYNQLVRGIFSEENKNILKNIAEKMLRKNVHCIILACTELPLLLEESEIGIPLLNTTKIHAAAAIKFAIE